MSHSFFSSTYSEARHRFTGAAEALGAKLFSHELETDSSDRLTIDVAVLGAETDPAVILSTGVHGVEGFFGSAIQLALLTRLEKAESRPPIRHVLVHAVNPYGFAHLRRVNEDNVDLNRNFRLHFDDLPPAPQDYAGLDGFLNPPSPPTRRELFKLKATWHILRKGLPVLKQAIAGGQYQFPRGLFFGGKAPCQSTRIVQEHAGTWLGSSKDILHIDFHSGLGRFATYRMLIADAPDSEGHRWHAATFGSECVEPLSPPASDSDNVAYEVSGLFGEWMQKRFGDRTYLFAAAEFGTYGGVRVLQALRAENRAHHRCGKTDPRRQRAKQELLECFCPQSPPWRNKVVEAGLRIIAQGEQGLLGN